MGGISILEIEKKCEYVTPDGRSWTKEEAEGRANWLSFLRDKDAGTYSLSVRDNDPQKVDHVEHYRIQMHEGNGFIITQQSAFPMLLWRVPHYQSIWNCNTPVAVKTLKEGTSADLLAEANFMKRVRHERLLQSCAVCSDREPIYKVTSNGSLLDYLKDGTGKDTKLTTHVDMGAHITIAKKSIEKELDNVPPDDGGMVKERPIEAANENTNLLCPLEKEEELKETDKNAALGEQNTSLPPASNNKTWIAKFLARVCSLIAYGPKNKWIFLFVLLGIFGNVGANGQGIVVKLKPSRSVYIVTNETIAATDPVPQAQSYLIYESGGNHPRSYICTSEFVENNQICNIVVGDKNKTECEGLRIFENETHTHLAVDGSKLTHDRTEFCIYQQAPGNFSLYFLVVYKNQDINDCASYPCQNGGACLDGLDSYSCNCAKGYVGANCEIDINECAPNPCQNGGACVDGLDSYTCNCAKGYGGANCEIAPETNHYKVAFYILLGIDVFILLVIAIVIKKNFPCIRAWWKKYIMKQEPTDDTENGPPSPTVGTTMLSEAERATR